jgi:hypothetical protein
MTAPLARDKLLLIYICPEMGGGTDRTEVLLLCSQPGATPCGD